jgi:hypothetical protein
MRGFADELFLGVAQAVKSLLSVLDSVEQTAKDTPPVDNGKSRFGNPAFKTFYDCVADVSLPFAVVSDFADVRLRAESDCSSCYNPWTRSFRRERAVGLLLRMLGQQDASRLRERDGAQLYLLVVSSDRVLWKKGRLMALCTGCVFENWE